MENPMEQQMCIRDRRFHRSLAGPGIIDVSHVGTGSDGEPVITYVADMEIGRAHV